MESVKTLPCKCINTGKFITCEQCYQTIQDMDYDKRDCNHLPISIDSVAIPVDRKRKHIQQQKEAIRAVIRCSCGNVFSVIDKASERECRKCQAIWTKKDKDWIMTEKPVNKGTVTLGQLMNFKPNNNIQNTYALWNNEGFDEPMFKNKYSKSR